MRRAEEMPQKKLIMLYSLNQSIHWFIIGLLIPVLALLLLEKGKQINKQRS
jgi:DHA1 family quinolone resistance protein-like MFS transporter